ncbi:MAG: hypothetical protein H5T76_29355 [Streptomyces sp.]|uniref:hypothetical protein n=1 Tax=Streptomyces sp. B93 TaxID=2824875 RepID=UPI00199D875F|nr:hypothetical protein [Streptomyces sp. B93]MBC7272768.1 hypothetical protein [Streptomyces sp.]MBQ1092436.1 hypothetical protein [Streptomyces sp. B93]
MTRKTSRPKARTACLGGCAAALAALLSAWPATVTVNIATEHTKTIVVGQTTAPGVYRGEICPL